MAITGPKFEYNPTNYIVKFLHKRNTSYLILIYNVDHKYQFVDLKEGRLFNVEYDTVEEAEKMLACSACIIEKNAMETTYVP